MIVAHVSGVIFFCSCKDRYTPSVTRSNLNYLVVDGILNNSTDSTFIRLSRTRRLDSSLINSGEKNAEMSIEDNAGNTLYYFKQLNDNGTYAVPGLNLTAGNMYRLRIKTANGKEYLSDEIPVQQSPRIDSITWKKTDKGVTIYANTHDPLNNTKYYRWDYTETWQYHSAYVAQYMYVDYGLLIQRFPGYYECWKSQVSKPFFLASSEKLSQDIIFENPIRFIPINSIELTIKYSILVKQYTLTKEAYEYLVNLRKNTEQTGSIFDPQPSELTGNIHAVNSSEPVLGFVTACTIDSQRIYISHQDVKPWVYVYPCKTLKFPKAPPKLVYYYFNPDAEYAPINLVPGPNLQDSMLGSTKGCVDCRKLGGSTTKPSFWQ